MQSIIQYLIPTYQRVYPKHMSAMGVLLIKGYWEWHMLLTCRIINTISPRISNNNDVSSFVMPY